ncbi:hypothetical protein CEUSTIGMA_g6027.t1 [Chlamydomonas eustigma]|uniref:Uncharacterized protein n=1 Tax=Chlamydomonas eustigma TaxID=1157962 RepID=A0A250X687_9CHLO|nr:hypothetical protein CEUSTIGMA_g6027.t1 [Chlamydomonas eustigma]|eukprot:GAX78588.1 hypothetical protein CEUSTIGMA_g6027.t1 [Chlamydomonas eustigma]
MRDKARSKSPLCKVDKESPKREKKAVSTISTAYGSGVRKEHDEKKLDAVNNLKSKPIHSLPEAMHQCTLQSLGPEDKQKVTKLLKQVVDMGKENKSLKEDHEKELKNLNDRVQQLQTCTKNMARENVSLKSKLSQMLIVLRTYQHKVLLMDAAFKASSHAGGTLQPVMQGQDQYVQQGQDQPPVQRGQDQHVQQSHDSVLLTSNQSFRQDGHVAETGIYSPTQMTEASGGHATAADSQGVATSPAASASAAGLVLQPAATAFEPSFQPSNNHSHVLLMAQSTPTAASNTSSCQQTTTCALHSSYSEINNVQQSLPAFDAPSIPAVHNSYHSVFNSEAGASPDPVTSTSAAYNHPFQQQVMINHDGSLSSTGEVEPFLVTTSAIASSNSIKPGARQSTALTNIPATAYGTINITIQHLQEQPIRDMGLATKSDSLQQASWSSDQGHTPHDVQPLSGKHSSEVIPFLTYPKTSEELSTQARHEEAETVEMCFMLGRREVGIQCSATDSPRQECRVETSDETMAEVAEGKIGNEGAALSQASMNLPDRHDVSTTIKKEPPSTLIFRHSLGMGARPESRYPTIITSNQNSPKEKGNSSSSPPSLLNAADHLLASSSHGIPRPSRYLPPTITREALLNPHHPSMHGSTKPLLGRSLVVAASTSSDFNGPIEEEEVCSGSTEEAHISSPILVMSGDIAAAEIAARLRDWQASQGLFVEDHEGHQAAASNKALCYDPSIGVNGAFYFSDIPVVDNKQTKSSTLRPALNTVQTLSDTAELPPPLCDRLTHPHGGCNKPPPCVASVTPSSSISVLRNNVDPSSTSTAVSRSTPPTDSALHVQYPCQDSQIEVPTPSPSCSGSCQAQVPSHTGAAYSKAKSSGSAGSVTRSGTSSSKAVQEGPHSRSLNTVASDVCVGGVHIRDQQGGRLLRGRMPGFVTMAEQDSLSMLSGRNIKLFDTDEVTSNNPAQISGFQEVSEFDLVDLLRQAEEFLVNSPAMQPQLMRPGSASSSTQIVRTAARTSTRRATTTSSPRVLMASPSSVAIAAQQGQQQVLAPHQTIPEYEENDLILAILQQELSIGDMSNRTNCVL